MLRRVTDLHGFTLLAMDGEIGTLEQFYFDDQTWAIRYLVVNTGTWLSDRLVLISPIAVGLPLGESKELAVKLTKKQVKASPNIDTKNPVSRQHETEFLGHFGYPLYWNAPYSKGPMPYAGVTYQGPIGFGASLPLEEKDPVDVHLRSTKEVTGYYLEATDGEVGYVENFLIENHTWAIRYIVVDTRNWWPGKKVLISPHWIKRVSWADNNVLVDLSREAIKSGPEYIESAPVTREYEAQLWDHHKRSAYRQKEAEHPASSTMESVY